METRKRGANKASARAKAPNEQSERRELELQQLEPFALLRSFSLSFRNALALHSCTDIYARCLGSLTSARGMLCHLIFYHSNLYRPAIWLLASLQF